MSNSPMKIAAPTHHSTSRAVASGQPRLSTMTFLFTDIEGSTRQWEQVPDMHGRVERHFEMLRRTVGELGGSVFATMGPYPTEADAVRAADSARVPHYHVALSHSTLNVAPPSWRQQELSKRDTRV